jgi:hypothetical protein
VVDEFQVENKAWDWIDFDVPEGLAVGKPFEATLRLQGEGVKPGLKLRADLHWSRANGSFGGMNAFGGEAQDVSGEGPYRFRMTPVEKPGLRNFVLTVWLTPSGEWSDHTSIAQFQIAKQKSESEATYKSPQVGKSNFLLETYFRTVPDSGGGVLLEKMDDAAGYSLMVNDHGGVAFAVKAGGEAVKLVSRSTVDDGQWHHVIAEADREARALTLYVDGRRDASGTGVGGDVSLANGADLYAGGTARSLSGWDLRVRADRLGYLGRRQDDDRRVGCLAVCRALPRRLERPPARRRETRCRGHRRDSFGHGIGTGASARWLGRSFVNARRVPKNARR